MPKHTDIEILFEGGNLTVKPPADDECTAGDPHKACGWKKNNVKWFRTDSSRFWAVIIMGPSPFKHGKRVFTSDHGPAGGLVETNLDEHEEVKYWVFAEDEAGKVHSLDPIIVIRDDKTAEGHALRQFAGDVEAMGQEADELASAARELTETTREMIPVLEELLRRHGDEPQP